MRGFFFFVKHTTVAWGFFKTRKQFKFLTDPSHKPRAGRQFFIYLFIFLHIH